MTDGYDIIGDVHGCADQLEALLRAMGYEERDGCFRHRDTKPVFLGHYWFSGQPRLSL